MKGTLKNNAKPVWRHSWRNYLLSENEKQLIKQFPQIRRKLRNWFEKNARDYPWRKTNNWFHLLMAEMMLRRTRADQVVPVYEEFSKRFQNPKATENMPAKQLKELLYPLGLVWRAEQIMETLTYLREKHPDQCPQSLELFKTIPGVGEYSAAMLANRLLGKRVAAVDVNVARFHSRLLGHEAQAESRRKMYIIALANRFVASPNAAELNLAVIDFAALICKARKPRCQLCPLRTNCTTGKVQGLNAASEAKL